jgi:hypothetical protein
VLGYLSAFLQRFSFLIFFDFWSNGRSSGLEPKGLGIDPRVCLFTLFARDQVLLTKAPCTLAKAIAARAGIDQRYTGWESINRGCRAGIDQSLATASPLGMRAPVPFLPRRAIRPRARPPTPRLDARARPVIQPRVSGNLRLRARASARAGRAGAPAAFSAGYSLSGISSSRLRRRAR